MVRVLRPFGPLLAAGALCGAFLLLAQRPGAQEIGRAPQQAWEVQKGIVQQGLVVFPIVSLRATDPLDAPEYITLDEGLKQRVVVITEVGGGGTSMIRNRPPRQGGSVQTQQLGQSAGGQSQQAQQAQRGAEVNRLLITNKSGRKLILLSGEMVTGGQQDRIVQKDMLLPPSDKPFDLSVFCVEHGRWTPKSVQFQATDNALVLGGAVADPTVRGAAQGLARQEAVWQKVAEKNSNAGAGGVATGTYQGTISSDKAQRDAKPYMDAITVAMPKNAIGAVIAIHGEIVWVDAFRSRSLFERYWPKLLQSYVIDALTTTPPPAKPGGPRILRSPPTVAQATKFLFDRSGKGGFEGIDGVYLLRRIESPEHLIFQLEDLDTKLDPLVHFNKMKKR